MKKKKLWTLLVLSVLVVLSSIIIFWFYVSKPISFPTNEELVNEMNGVFPEANVTVIQEAIPINDRHVVVPFISKEGNYGLSYWIWKQHKWSVASIDTKGEPKVWEINRKDPSSFYFVWNIHPEDQLSSIHFYLIRDRGYRVTNGIENYSPKIQMEKKVSLHGKSYGVMKLPVEWEGIMKSNVKVESAKQPDLFFNNFFPERTMYFGWIPYDQSGKEFSPMGSVNGNGYLNNHVDIEYIRMLGKNDLELPFKQ